MAISLSIKANPGECQLIKVKAKEREKLWV